MAGLAKVFAGVLVWARIAAADVAAGQAHPQMRPGVLAQLGAVLALPGGKRLGFVRLQLERCSQVFGAADAFASRPRDLFSMLTKDRT